MSRAPQGEDVAAASGLLSARWLPAAAGLVLVCLSMGSAGARENVADAAVAPARIAVPLATAHGGEGSGGIVVIDATGRRLATLTRPRAGREDSEPAWSPDGRWLAFTRTTDGRRSFQIYVMRANGTGVRRITHGRFDYSPAWSPDAKWIAYTANGLLHIIHPDGTGDRAVRTRRPTLIGWPAWAPGGRIAYSYFWDIPQDWPAACRQRDSGCGYVVSSALDGSRRRLVVRGRDAHWSPDGRTIVYTGPDGGVRTAPGRGGAGHMLGRGYLAEWSGDGRQIVYARMGNTAAQDSVWIMNRDGTHAHRVLRGGSDPSWQP